MNSQNLINEHFIEAKILTFENLLLPWEQLWSKEPLDFPDLVYPQQIEELVEKMITLKLEELEHFLRWDVLKLIPEWNEIHKAFIIPKINKENYTPPPKQKKMGKKKFHEIEEILRLMLSEDRLPNHLYDCAGGAGLFTQEFFHKTSNADPIPNATLIDKNPALLAMAKELSKSRLTIVHDNLLNLDLKSMIETKVDKKLLWLGLHACGPLTDFLLEKFPITTDGHICSIGCCYHLLSQNWIKEHDGHINLTNESLTLAAKGTEFLDITSLKHRFKVKSFRYPFEMALRKIFHFSGPLNLRSFPSQIYKGNYSDYLSAAMERLKYTPESYSEQKMIDFRDDANHQRHVNRLICLGLLRHFFSRPLEIYISYQRLLKLSRRLNRPVRDLGEIFNRSLSPRNILITSWK